MAHVKPLIAALDRRRMLQGAGVLGGLNVLGLGGCASLAAPSSGLAPPPAFAPVRASEDRLFDVTVCLRPFRAAGPRLDTEQVGDTLVVHNYGHGGSGWSLSWGSSTLAVQKAMGSGPKEIAVIGCGALGLTSAILAQKAGAQVTIYARDWLPETRSARATGSWTPDSRIALTDKAAPGFPALWEQMARISFKTYRGYLGLPGSPVEWNDRYILSDAPRSPPGPPAPGELDFADYGDRIRDITPASTAMPAGSTPFPTPFVRHFSGMMFNIADYGHTLLTDFRLAGGKIERAEFHSPSELAGLKEKVVINCPGYGAPRPVEGRVHRPRARSDRLADTAAGSELRRHLQGREHVAAPRWDRHADGRWRATCAAMATTTRPPITRRPVPRLPGSPTSMRGCGAPRRAKATRKITSSPGQARP